MDSRLRRVPEESSGKLGVCVLIAGRYSDRGSKPLEDVRVSTVERFPLPVFCWFSLETYVMTNVLHRKFLHSIRILCSLENLLRIRRI